MQLPAPNETALSFGFEAEAAAPFVIARTSARPSEVELPRVAGRYRLAANRVECRARGRSRVRILARHDHDPGLAPSRRPGGRPAHCCVWVLLRLRIWPLFSFWAPTTLPFDSSKKIATTRVRVDLGHRPRQNAGEPFRLPDLHPRVRVDVGPERDQLEEAGNVVVGCLDVDVLDRAGLLGVRCRPAAGVRCRPAVRRCGRPVVVAVEHAYARRCRRPCRA